MKDQNHLIYSAFHKIDGKKERNDLYADTFKNKNIGDTITHHAGAPGVGKIIYEITAMNTCGIYGKIIHDSVYVPDEDFYY